MIFIGVFIIQSSSFAEVAATVNGKDISVKELTERLQENMLYVSSKQISKKRALFDIINRQLGIERAKKNKLGDNAIVKKKMEDILYHAQISKDLAPQFKRIVVTDSDVKKYYKNHKEYRTAHILFRIQSKSTPKENEAAFTQAQKIYKALRSHPDKFAEFANKFSQSSSAPSGGDMGHQVAVRLAPEYFKAISEQKLNYITPPVRTQFGFHIIKVLDVKKYGEIDQQVYKKIVYDQKRDAIIEKYFAELRQNAKIKIKAKI